MNMLCPICNEEMNIVVLFTRGRCSHCGAETEDYALFLGRLLKEARSIIEDWDGDGDVDLDANFAHVENLRNVVLEIEEFSRKQDSDEGYEEEDDKERPRHSFWSVDLPRLEGPWIDLGVYTSKKKAIDYVQDQFDADDEGRICLVTEIEDDTWDDEEDEDWSD